VKRIRFRRVRRVVAAFLGNAVTRAARLMLEQSGTGDRLMFRNVAFQGKGFESPIYYGYRAGYYFTRHFGLEAEFIHLKIYAGLDRPVNVEGRWNGSVIREGPRYDATPASSRSVMD
jgi:hypothetical protein